MRHYLDHASTTPLRPAAARALEEWVERLGRPDGSGDPARVHQEGREARAAIEEARSQVAQLAGVSPRRVVFTSGATEAANTAVASAGAAVVFCARVEHSSVRAASHAAAPTVEVAVGRDGTIDAEHLAALLGRAAREAPAPALVHCQWANHEIGTIQPVAEVAEVAERFGATLHVDAAAAFGHVPVELGELPFHYASVSAHKMGGPAGVGALLLGRGVRMRPLLVGGSEERARRAGAENLLGIVGFGAAAAAVTESGGEPEDGTTARASNDVLGRESRLAAAWRDRIVASATGVDGVELAAPVAASRRLPHIACVSITGVLGEAVLLALDQAGIAAHSGSACSSEVLEPSPVLEAIGMDPDRSLRLSVGWSTTEADVEAFEAVFPPAVSRLRSLGSG